MLKCSSAPVRNGTKGTPGTNGGRERVDMLKERVRDAIWVAGQKREFVTARAIVQASGVSSRDPLRVVKIRIEALRDEGCPIVGLPEHPGPGYTWIHEPDSDWAREIIARFKRDMGSRVKRMMKHLAVLERCSVADAQTELFAEEGLGARG